MQGISRVDGWSTGQKVFAGFVGSVAVGAVAMAVLMKLQKARVPSGEMASSVRMVQSHNAKQVELIEFFEKHYAETWHALSPEQQRYFLEIGPHELYVVRPGQEQPLPYDASLFREYIYWPNPEVPFYAIPDECRLEYAFAQRALENVDSMGHWAATFGGRQPRVVKELFEGARLELEVVRGRVSETAWLAALQANSIPKRRAILSEMTHAAREILKPGVE